MTTIPPQQYYVTRRPPETDSSGIETATVGEWCVVHDAAFSVVPVFVGDERVGIVFGTVLDVEGRTTDGAVRLDAAETDAGVGTLFEDVLRDLLGRFVGLLCTGTENRVYPDTAGALPVVHDERSRVVASAPVAMPDIDHRERFRSDLFEAVTWPLISRGSTSWVPGELTYYSGIGRVLPNHYLDLDRWETVRYWPNNEEAVRTTRDASEEIASIATTLESAFASIVSTYDRPKLALTAGKDSRSLMAAARPFVESGELPLYTLGESDYDLDVHVARRIAAATGADWEPLPTVEATPAEQREWLERTGYTVSSAIKEIFPTLRTLDADVQVGGLGGEIGRGYYWKDGDDERSPVDPEELLLRFYKPEHPELVSTLESWCRDVAAFDTYTTLDLAYQEHRLGCWGGPQHLGLPPTLDYVRPLWYRPVVESMYRLPPELRRRDRLPTALVEHCWPELNDLPYNAFTDNKKYWSMARRKTQEAKTVLTHPRLTASYLSRKYL